MIQSCDTGQQIPWWTYIYWQQTILWEPKFLGCIDNQILVNYSAPLQSETKLLGRITIFNRVLTSLHQPHFWFNVVKRLNSLSYFSCLVSQLWKGIKGDIQDTKKLLNSTSSTAGWNARKLCSVKTTLPTTFVSDCSSLKIQWVDWHNSTQGIMGLLNGHSDFSIPIAISL